ncbi:MAG TPA: hypothetical protein VJ895_00525 [Candidatus Nanoarchaeia archaeon]|nr:hypothetical protein [Candidatus Nanoarchaeia archaeon]
MKIGIDLDDTLWKFHESFFKFYNNKFGTNYKVQDYWIYNLETFLGIEREETNELFEEYESLEEYKYIPLLDGVKEGLDFVYKNFEEVHYLTARPIFHENLIKNRLSKIIEEEPILFFQLDENRKRIEDKSDYCIRNDISIMIDDGYHNLEGCSEKGIKSFLIDYAWNRDKNLNGNIVRVKNWKEIVEKLEEIK